MLYLFNNKYLLIVKQQSKSHCWHIKRCVNEWPLQDLIFWPFKGSHSNIQVLYSINNQYTLMVKPQSKSHCLHIKKMCQNNMSYKPLFFGLYSVSISRISTNNILRRLTKDVLDMFTSFRFQENDFVITHQYQLVFWLTCYSVLYFSLKMY